MKNPKQYKDTGTPIEAPVTTKKSSTKTVTDIKLTRLEEAVANQDKVIAKLKRDISRLKDQIGDITQVLNRRG